MTTIAGNLHPFPRRQPRSQRHKWGDPIRFEFKTERACVKCGLVKVTRHEPGQHPWIEFHHGLDRMPMSGRVPPCEGVS